MQLTSGAVMWLLDEAPVAAEGYTWHHVVVNATYATDSPSGKAPCHEVPTQVGWVAAGPADDPWWEPAPCPDAPATLDALSESASDPMLALDCFSRDPLTVEGYYPPIPEGIGFSCPGIEPTWLTCSVELLTTSIDGQGLHMRVQPTIAMPPRGERIVVTGHFDDPAAATCLPADPAYVSQLAATFYCRTQFVIDAAQPAT